MAKKTTAAGTPATTLLTQAGVPHTVHTFEASDRQRDQTRGAKVSFGLEAAEALGVEPERVFKTLVADVDGVLVVGIVPVVAQLDLKALAAAAGGKRAVMAEVAAAERSSGYVAGGISPLGQRRPLPTVADETVLLYDTVFVSGGRRGLDIELAPADLIALTSATTADIARANPARLIQASSTVSSGMETKNLAESYELPPIEWTAVQDRLNQGITQAPGSGGPHRHTCWLTTLDADGSPHVTGVGALWADGAFWFETGDGTRKAKNIARDPRCCLAVALHEFDLVVEGTAEKVTDPASVAAMAERWAAAGWPARVDEGGQALTAEYSAPSAGPPPWYVYRLVPVAATGLATIEPGGATRWRF